MNHESKLLLREEESWFYQAIQKAWSYSIPNGEIEISCSKVELFFKGGIWEIIYAAVQGVEET